MLKLLRHKIWAIFIFLVIYLILLSVKFVLLNEECSETKYRKILHTIEKGPMLYIITPTHYSTTQLADLTRLSQTLMNIANLHWIVAEESESKNPIVKALLERTKLRYTHLNTPYPEKYKGVPMIGRGVFNRRIALEWVRENVKEGVVYFADDDNTYDLRLFNEIRWTKIASVFPVGMIQKYGLSSPIVQNGKVIGFHDAFQGGRKFAIDMAGFAINVWLILAHPTATIPTRVSYLEDGFLRQLGLELQDLEPMSEECTEIFVWHTRTQRPGTPNYKHLGEDMLKSTNLMDLYRNVNAIDTTENKH